MDNTTIENNLIGKIVQHEGRIYQILAVNHTLVTAHSYAEDCDIKETIFICKRTGKVIARKNMTK